jgi:hypothetical protein
MQLQSERLDHFQDGVWILSIGHSLRIKVRKHLLSCTDIGVLR